MFTLTPLTLTTDKIRLVPLTIEHLDEFYQAGKNAELWRWIPVNLCEDISQTKAWLAKVLTEMQHRRQLAFIIFEINNKRFVSSTLLFDANIHDSSIEIGHTFIEQ